MSTNFEKIERDIQALNSKEKATLARTLIEALDETEDQHVEEMWVKETERRYKEYKAGNIQAIPGEEAMQRARQKLK